MPDQVDNTQNIPIPPPKKDELSSADPNQFKQVMKELTTDTEQKGKWKPQKEEILDEENSSAVEDPDEVTTSFESSDNELGPITQASSSAASTQVSGASEADLSNEGGKDKNIISQPTQSSAPASGTQETHPSKKPEPLAGQPITLSRSEKMGSSALDKKGIQAGEPLSALRTDKLTKGQADAAALGGVPLATPLEQGSTIVPEKEKAKSDLAASLPSAPMETPLAQDTTIPSEKEKFKTKKGSSFTPADIGTPIPQQQMQDASPIHSLEPASYTQMVPALQEFFQKLVGVLTVMQASGISETVIKLNAPTGSRLSIFNGSEISIKEYTSAPKIFNIQFKGNPEAVNLVQGNLGSLMVAFSDKEYNFKINRFDIGHISDEEKPLFKRKEAISGNDAG